MAEPGDCSQKDSIKSIALSAFATTSRAPSRGGARPVILALFPVLLLVRLDAFGDDLAGDDVPLGLGDVGLFALELLVDGEEMLHFVHHVRGEIVDRLIGRVGRVAVRQGDDLLVHLAPVLHRDHADREAADERAVQDRLRAEDQHVERVAVLRESAGDEPVVRGIVGRGIKDAVQDQHPGLFVEFVLLFLPFRDLDTGEKIVRGDAFGRYVVPDVHRKLLFGSLSFIVPQNAFFCNRGVENACAAARSVLYCFRNTRPKRKGGRP